MLELKLNRVRKNMPQLTGNVTKCLPEVRFLCFDGRIKTFVSLEILIPFCRSSNCCNFDSLRHPNYYCDSVRRYHMETEEVRKILKYLTIRLFAVTSPFLSDMLHWHWPVTNYEKKLFCACITQLNLFLTYCSFHDITKIIITLRDKEAYVIHVYFRPHPFPASNMGEALPMNSLSSSSTKPNNWDRRTGFTDSVAEENTNSAYYEEISDADPGGKRTTASNASVRQGTACESIGDVMSEVYTPDELQRRVSYTESGTYDDVMAVGTVDRKTNNPVCATPDSTSADIMSYDGNIHEPVTGMGSVDETLLLDNCIYEDADQEWLYKNASGMG